jgi:cell wall-associated NlpC family hydrolase
MTQCQVENIKKYLSSRYPEEACGIIVDGGFLPCENILPKSARKTGFQIASGILKRYAGRIQAVIHSHIDEPACPSVFDMRRQIEANVPWYIGVVTKNGVADDFWFGKFHDDVKNLPFRHGVSDCYSLVRDWYKIDGTELPDFPRAWKWWKTSDLLTESFESAGFRRLAVDEPKLIGDVICIGVKTDIPHHCAIYLGNDRILHHPGARLPYDPHRKPMVESVYRWVKYIKFWLRYAIS